jgi:hypothetical protein
MWQLDDREHGELAGASSGRVDRYDHVVGVRRRVSVNIDWNAVVDPFHKRLHVRRRERPVG